MRGITIATLAATLFIGLSVRADAPIKEAPVCPNGCGPVVYKTHWVFTELLGYHYEDYSTNLGIPLAATLPIEAVKAGWACVREVPADLGIEMIGKFGCTDADRNYMSAFAHCSKSKIDTNTNRLVLKVPGAPDGIDFRVSCTTLSE